MKIAESCGLSVIGETDFASSYCSNQIFAITGTNGKTTLTTFLGHLWQRAGRLGVVAGNVGTPLSEIVSSGIDPKFFAIFLEVSSFQAQNLRFLKPSTLLWTNFAPDHLDYHLSLKEYFLAKKNLMNRLAPEGFAMVGSSVAAYATSEKIPMKNSPIEVGEIQFLHFCVKKPHFSVVIHNLKIWLLLMHLPAEMESRMMFFFKLSEVTNGIASIGLYCQARKDWFLE